MRSNFFTSTFTQISQNWISLQQSQSIHKSKPIFAQPLRLLCVLAHPDDESLCLGGTLAKYAAEGVEISLVVATRGERGWRGGADTNPGFKRVGQMREGELRAAARMLGVREIVFLDYMDGQVADAPANDLVAKLVRALRRLRPDVVITFDPHGMYGHPDHIAISQAATNAVFSAADDAYAEGGSLAPHRVRKLYYRVYSDRALASYQSVFGELKMDIQNVVRAATSWQEWAMTTQLNTADQAATVWQAISCHATQFVFSDTMRAHFITAYADVLSNESYYRVFSTVPGKRTQETDLFQGILIGCGRYADLVESLPYPFD